MIYITGDTHGDISRFRRFRRIWKRRRDFCIVCGDFGFVWDGGESEQRALQDIEKLDCTVLFIEGTHDNLDLLSRYPEEEYCGGHARRIAKNLLWLRRGDVFAIDGLRVFALGGGESTDADERIPGVSWWPQEMPTPDELVRARENLAACGDSVDLIVTHQHPRVELGLIDDRSEQVNHLSAFLGEVNRTVLYRRWFFGGEHLDRDISARMSAVFERFLAFS